MTTTGRIDLNGYAVLRRWEDRVYSLVRSGAAGSAAQTRVEPWSLDRLAGHRYCLLISYRRDGTAVPTPMWFGTTDGRVYLRSGASDGKVQRVRRNPSVLLAPCSARGRPLGPPMAGAARIVARDEEPHAERALQANYGLARRLYRMTRGSLPDAVYLEVRPAPAQHGPGG